MRPVNSSGCLRSTKCLCYILGTFNLLMKFAYKVGGWVKKRSKICLHNIWMVPKGAVSSPLWNPLCFDIENVWRSLKSNERVFSPLRHEKGHVTFFVFSYCYVKAPEAGYWHQSFGHCLISLPATAHFGQNFWLVTAHVGFFFLKKIWIDSTFDCSSDCTCWIFFSC